MRKSRKLIKFCLALIITLAGSFFIINGNVTPVQAASRMVVLKGNRTYSGYDFTRNGKKDRFRCTADSERGYVRIYLNGKFKQRLFIGKGANIYWCKVSTKDTYLLSENYLYGGHELVAYMYSGGKFKKVSGTAKLNKVLSFPEFTKIKGNTLYVTSTPGTRNPSSFRNATTPLQVETKYKLKNKKISCLSWNSRVTGRRTFNAMTSFGTSKSVNNLNVKNGPRVRAGQKVTLNYIRLGGSSYIYQITVNGQTGWVENSAGVMFR